MFASINAWTLSKDLSAEQIAQTVKQAGFDAVELTVDESGLLTPDSTEQSCRQVAETFKSAGVKIASLATGLFWKFNYADPDPAVRQRAEDLTLHMLDMAAWLGTDAILVVPAVVGRWNSPSPTVRYADALARTTEALHRLAGEAESRGVCIALENVWNRFLLSPVEFADLIDRANSPYVGAYLDVGNVMAFGYPEDWIATLGKRIVRIHIKDYDLSQPGAAGFCPLGAGSVNWQAVVAALKEVGYDGPLTFEGSGEPADIRKRMKSTLGV